MKSVFGRRAAAVALLAAVVLAGGCGPFGSAAPASTPEPNVSLTGAGATLPEPFYAKAFYVYNQLHPSISIIFQPVGSGTGVSRFSSGITDFGASDVPMNAAELAQAGGADQVVQVPGTLGAIAIVYNLPGVTGLRIDGPTLAMVYQGIVTRWDDPGLALLNPGLQLPPDPIRVIHRSDASGTSFHFTSYLSLASESWRTSVGAGKTVAWPVGGAGAGNDAVGNQVKATAGSLGYVELSYALQSQLQSALLKDRAGNFVAASAAGAVAAAAAAGEITPEHFSILDQPGPGSYPIASFSWVLLHRHGTDPIKQRALKKLFNWLLTDGQAYAGPLGYGSLPKSIRDAATQSVGTLD